MSEIFDVKIRLKLLAVMQWCCAIASISAIVYFFISREYALLFIAGLLLFSSYLFFAEIAEGYKLTVQSRHKVAENIERVVTGDDIYSKQNRFTRRKMLALLNKKQRRLKANRKYSDLR